MSEVLQFWPKPQPNTTKYFMNTENMVFVFGSNLAGIHGAGAAAKAHMDGFPMHLGVGYYASPKRKMYALPTKDCKIQSIWEAHIQLYVNQLIDYADDNPDKLFQVTRVGCGLAGFKDEEIAPMFSNAGPNMYFDSAWERLMPVGTRFWGTF